jgi:carbonic anhydrase/acetyltransferase-like protein (isoleucine patch superfamily)
MSLSADIGEGFWIGHFGGIEVINCRLAERCSVGQQTKVGRAEQLDGPQIGDGVWIGAHAKIFGPVKVGAHATIAPGACVPKDVPGNSLIVGAPRPHRLAPLRQFPHPAAHVMAPGRSLRSVRVPRGCKLRTTNWPVGLQEQARPPPSMP